MKRVLATVVLPALISWAHAERGCVTIAPTTRPPVIDGVLSRGEWDECAAVSGFTAAGGGGMAQPSTTAFLTYDERAVYVAFRCEEAATTYPRGFVRGHDDRAFEDDCVQVFLAPQDVRQTPDARIAFGGYAGSYDTWYQEFEAYYEFTVNCMGSTTEARNDVRDWNGVWEAKACITPGAWTAELAIPFATLGVGQVPSGGLWGLNLFRHRPPDLSGWVNPSFGGYTPLPLGAMYLGSGPVARLTDPSVPRLGPNDLTLTLRNPSSTPAQAELSLSHPGAEAVTHGIPLPPRSSLEVTVPFALAGHGDLTTTYRIALAGVEIPLLSGALPLHVAPPHQLVLRYYSLPGFVEGTVQLGPNATAQQAVLTLELPGGSSVEEQRAALTPAQGTRLRVPVKGKTGDRFRAVLRLLDGEGHVTAEKAREIAIPARPAWLGTAAGLPLDVLPPWTPIRVQGHFVEMLGKRFSFDDFALPAAIVSAGAELLAAPVSLVVRADGADVPWQSRELQVVEQTDDHVKLVSRWRAPTLELEVSADLEYDGFCWVELSLNPTGQVTVDRVALEVPFRPEACRFAHEGHAQAAHALSPFGLRRPIGENLWLGDERRGIAFLAESLEWVRSADRASQVEVLPQGEVTLWRTTLLDIPTKLTEPYTARFALHITPTKPVSLRKSRIYHGAYYGLETARSGGGLEFPAAGNLNLERGTLECWVKPTFDPEESYDESVDRSQYNRMFLVFGTTGGDAAILYFNADDRSMRLVTKAADDSYPVILGGPVHLPPERWSYVALSWGNRLRLSINGTVAEYGLKGLLRGELGRSRVRVDLAAFQLDELRISGIERPLEAVPEAPFAPDPHTLFLTHCEEIGEALRPEVGSGSLTVTDCRTVEGRFGNGLASTGQSALDRLARDGYRIVIFHENWSRYHGYPDLEQIPRLKPLVDACHQRGMRFLVYFGGLMSDAAPEWPGMENDFMALPERMWYHREDVVQDCYVSCVNGPYGDLLLDGIAKLADQAGIDGVYMDGTTVPWDCANPTHPGCGEYQGDGTYLPHIPVRATRYFMKRLRNIFVQRGKEVFLDAHTGGAINIATQSFCDGFYEGEQLARYRPGVRLSPDVFVTGYMGQQFGFRSDFLPNRHTMDQALAISLVHDTAVRGQPPAVDRAWADYEDHQTRFIPYWEGSPLYEVRPPQVLGSLYLKPDRALLVLGSQTEETTECEVNLENLLRQLPEGVHARDAISGVPLPLDAASLRFSLPPRHWRMIEIR